MDPLLSLSSITKSFGAVQALRDVSFTLFPGEIHALLGENGAGKSTLIKILAGAHQPENGSISILGKPVSNLTPAIAHRLGISVVYQQPALFPDLSVAENIAIRLEPTTWLRKIRWSQRTENASRLLSRVGARFTPDRDVGTLSMPEQQLVEIACALGSSARVLVLDEPTASLTQQEQRLLFETLRNLTSQEVGIIYISHRLDEIFAIAHRVTVLRDGISVGTHSLANASAIAKKMADESSTARMTENDLIRLMVGREFLHSYPAREKPPGDIVVSLHQLGSAQNGVHHVDLEIRSGEIVGLAGLVGSGRTELAEILFGLTPATTGHWRIHEIAVSVASPQQAIAQGIAYLPENRRRHGLVLEMAIGNNVTLAILSRIFPGAWLRSRTESEVSEGFIHELGIKATGPDALGSSLSGGNQQKVAIARWLATRPKFLILDEPTQGVDVGAKHEIHKIIRQLANQGIAILLISSDLPEILGMSDRIGVMRNRTVSQWFSQPCTGSEVMAAALGPAPIKTTCSQKNAKEGEC